MPLFIVRQDISKMQCDAIVNPTGQDMNFGGAELSIRTAAGPDFEKALKRLGKIKVGKVKITDGFGLRAKYVIHTVGPVWRGGGENEEQLLADCYKGCLALAAKRKCESIAVPLISSGRFGYPKDRVLKVAMNAVYDFLMEREMDVYLVVYDRDSYEISKNLFSDVQNYIESKSGGTDDIFAAKPSLRERRRQDALDLGSFSVYRSEAPYAQHDDMLDFCEDKPNDFEQTLMGMLRNMDESFSVMLMKLIDKKGISEVECYKRANVKKQTWYKILNEKDYRPGKNTVLSFAIALELDISETERLLRSVGFSLSHSNRFDVIIEYFIIHKNYDIFEINETLFEFDQPLLGS